VKDVFAIGDRLFCNSTIDEETDERMHIDLDVPFEHGKTFLVPELVPFRLAQRLIHGMRQNGFEGVFDRLCQPMWPCSNNVRTSSSRWICIGSHECPDVLRALPDVPTMGKMISANAPFNVGVIPDFNTSRSPNGFIRRAIAIALFDYPCDGRI
jgi:hypothetical protein